MYALKKISRKRWVDDNSSTLQNTSCVVSDVLVEFLREDNNSQNESLFLSALVSGGDKVTAQCEADVLT